MAQHGTWTVAVWTSGGSVWLNSDGGADPEPSERSQDRNT